MPPSAATVSAVLFDYGLVLTGPPLPSAWAQMKSLLHAGEDAFHAAYWRSRHDYDLGVLSGDAYWQQVAGDVGQTLDEATLAALIEADTLLWTQPNQPMIDWAAYLQDSGITTGILSNLGDAMETGVRAHCPWLQRFNHLTFSHSLRMAKPDARIYAHAAAGLHLPPAEILFIDDREDNIAGALAAGMQAIRYTDHAAFLMGMQTRGLETLLAPVQSVGASDA